jgi:hypothetical protein
MSLKVGDCVGYSTKYRGSPMIVTWIEKTTVGVQVGEYPDTFECFSIPIEEAKPVPHTVACPTCCGKGRVPVFKAEFLGRN